MNFEFSDEQRQLHDAVERYLGDQYGFDRYQSIKGSAAGWDPSIWRGLADLGGLAITVPTAQGGLGFGPLETLAMMGDCGRRLLLEALLSSGGVSRRRRSPQPPRRPPPPRSWPTWARVRRSPCSRISRAARDSRASG